MRLCTAEGESAMRMFTFAFVVILCMTFIVSAQDSVPKPKTTVDCVPRIKFDFSKPGRYESLAYLRINSTDTNGFSLKFRFENSGNFISEDSSGIIPMTKIYLNPLLSNKGTLGSGLVPPSNIEIKSKLNKDGEYIWEPIEKIIGNIGPTTDYCVDLRVDWEDTSRKFAGNYSESIFVTVISNDL